MSMWWSLHLRREAASVPLARRFLLGTMETAGVDPDISYDLSVALSEACANAVEHGGDQGEPGTDLVPAGGRKSGKPCGQYRVTAYLDGEKCRIEVADSGPGFPSRRALRTAAQASAGCPSDQQPSAAHPTGEPARTRTATRPPDTAESGRGLCLIEELADHVHFGNRPGRGAVVSFDKVLKWREGALLMVS
ncbi:MULTISPECIES: ATP-binding protein [Streptomyces]|uniref:ATP-binding protein n=1 Tax=Streptomyces glycanivorans TaxID=3033808 RepID=A0ABY9JES7_9ACTN|nr:MULTISPECIES: ATP-binding protein [unclassified Streptomyces]WSQ78702.1 ATP-binding protein [Streptomyces sp. NBC_01213]TXS16976.1 ATP-binding protein [Streptomyces sp. wa22]WLQ65319.1 ATP-binding protein [Streptomyces sp. Alt3]WSQ86076.1 ATP-binding protein [Streptomyces sp. NBC_01212]WSR07848.1 ATP-binding protein [Streptomyces sp. NBC_01208]